MRHRLLIPLLGSAAITGLSLSAGLGWSGTSAKAADLAHSRWANRVSGYIVQDLLSGSSSQAPAAVNPQAVPGAVPLKVGTYGCSQTNGSNVRVNQDCTSNSVSRYAGRGQAQNETAIAVNPTNAQNLIGGQNDYRRGDGSCGADFSLDGGQHWGNALIPIGFTVPGVNDPSAARHYWTSSGDPSVAFDSTGAAYYTCGAFDRASPTSDQSCPNPAGSCASGLFVFRSVDGGASWNFPGGSTSAGGTGQVIVTPGLNSQTQFTLEDKQYMAIDAHQNSSFRDRIYVAWTHYTSCKASEFCETAAVYLSYSNDRGATFSTPKSISGSSAGLCGNALNPDTPNACDNNSFAQPVVGADGTLYVFFTNYNNAVSGTDNHNDILMVRSHDGGLHFSAPKLVSQYYDLPDCATYTGQDLFRSCVPTAPLSSVSIFRAANYPSAAADPSDPRKIYATFGSYINPHSNPSNPAGHGRCTPDGLDTTTFLNLYKGVGTVNGCNNDILLSVSTDGGNTWSAAQSGVENAAAVNDESTTQLADQWWQWAATNSAGRLAVSYYDRKYNSDQQNGSNDVTLAASTATGFAHVRVTSRSTPPPTEFPGPNGYSVFMGDYSGLAVSGTTAYPFWSDARNPELFQCPSTSDPLGVCRVTNANVPGFDEDVFSTSGLSLPG